MHFANVAKYGISLNKLYFTEKLQISSQFVKIQIFENYIVLSLLTIKKIAKSSLLLFIKSLYDWKLTKTTVKKSYNHNFSITRLT